MKIDLYERIWMTAVGVMLVLFFSTLANAFFRHGFRPASHVETIDPRKVMSNPGFRRQGVSVDSGGRLEVTVLGMMFVWLPKTITLPANTPVTFRMTSTDVIHGFQIVKTNGQAMVVPGYVSQFTTEFDPGEYLIACNEYCGVGHHTMAGKLVVVPKTEWVPPTQKAMGPVAAVEATHAAH